MITLNGTILGADGSKPDAGTTVEFVLDGPFTQSDNTSISPFSKIVSPNTSTGVFSVVLQATTTGVPPTRKYSVFVNGSFGGVAAAYLLGKIRLHSTTPVQLGDILAGDESPDLHISREALFGIIDGANTSFSLRRVPQRGSELLFVNEYFQRFLTAYTIDSNKLQLLVAPPVGTRLRAFYLDSQLAAPGHISRETPDGLVDGNNRTFTLRQTPATGLEMGFVNENFQVPGSAYTIAGNVITFNVAPVLGSDLVFFHPTLTLYPAHHRESFTGDGTTTSFALTQAIGRSSELLFLGALYQERNIPTLTNGYYVSADQKTLLFLTPPPLAQTITVYYEEGS